MPALELVGDADGRPARTRQRDPDAHDPGGDRAQFHAATDPRGDRRQGVRRSAAVLVAVGFSAEAGDPRARCQHTSRCRHADLPAAANQRCKNGGTLGPPGSDASGKLAFLPNHDYEVVVTTAMRVGSKDQGPRETTAVGSALLPHQGPAGPERGAERRRRYPPPCRPRLIRCAGAIPLYRQEPCVLAFENSLSSVLPIDRTPPLGRPAGESADVPAGIERRPGRLAGRPEAPDGAQQRLDPAHRANPYPPVTMTAYPQFAKLRVRTGPSSDPLVQRFDAVRKASPACGTPPLEHVSQVLLHEPIDANGASGPWEPATGYRATVRQRNGPFTERSGFDVYDLGAFYCMGELGGDFPWSVDDFGNLVAPSQGGQRFYASCGEFYSDWDHLVAQLRIDLRDAAAAGIAVGVAGLTRATRAVLAMVEKSAGQHHLALYALDAFSVRELVPKKPLTVNGPFLLQVTAFDDLVRASVGETLIEGPRGAIREGRVALVAQGAAAFAGISVGALDIYSFEFVTSKYLSFSEHLGSFDGTLEECPAGAFGGAPAPFGTVLSAHAGAIPRVMNASDDPQERQALFDVIVRELSLGLRKAPPSVSITRLTDAAGTFGLLLQSPEPISLTRDVKLNLDRIVLHWVPDPIPSTGPQVPRIPGPVPRGSPCPRRRSGQGRSRRSPASPWRTCPRRSRPPGGSRVRRVPCRP